MSNPIAILISDVHYNLQTLDLADKAVNMAIDKANELGVPLIVAGDLHDTKANLRGECVNAMLKTFQKAKNAYILVGNHDRLNEKAPEHSLNFLASERVLIIDKPFDTADDLRLVPYQHNTTDFLQAIDRHSINIVHQGIHGSNSGEYFQDKSAVYAKDVAGYRIISGHYHARQTITLPNGGKWDYIGNPFTLTFGEANDPEKGFQVLMSDGSLEFVPTKLRKHVIIEAVFNGELEVTNEVYLPRTNDIVWIKISGTKADLVKLTKEQLKKDFYPGDFRLELIHTEKAQAVLKKTSDKAELLDQILDAHKNADELKRLWRDLCE